MRIHRHAAPEGVDLAGRHLILLHRVPQAPIPSISCTRALAAAQHNDGSCPCAQTPVPSRSWVWGSLHHDGPNAGACVWATTDARSWQLVLGALLSCASLVSVNTPQIATMMVCACVQGAMHDDDLCLRKRSRDGAHPRRRPLPCHSGPQCGRPHKPPRGWSCP